MAIIEVENLGKRYGDHVALDGVSFEVHEGEIFGVLGPNGAGKTTTVECVEGLRRPDTGLVRVLGLDPHADARRLHQRIGVQLQESNLPDALKVGEALELYASFYEDPRDWRELLAQWGLADKRDARFGKLSGGQKQRLSIALALVGNPRVAFLDELTTGLDPQARRATWQLIKEIRDTGVTVVLVSHFMDEVEELCDRLMLLDAGRVVAMDSPAGVIAGADIAGQLRFRPMADLDEEALRRLPGVSAVSRQRDHVVVTGSGDFATAVTGLLARERVLVADLRIDQRTLDDAYLALTGRAFEVTA
jgi:ABC-2 type transport system ATP-binding protein